MGLLGGEAQKRQEIRDLSRSLEEVQGQLAGAAEALGLTKQVSDLMKAKQRLELELERMKEEHEREKREIEHKLGLHRKQIDHERDVAKKEGEVETKKAVTEARLAVREENLTQERERFQQEIEFRTKRFEEEAETLRNLTTQILDRLPRFDKTHTTHEYIGNPPGGSGNTKLALEVGSAE